MSICFEKFSTTEWYCVTEEKSFLFVCFMSVVEGSAFYFQKSLPRDFFGQYLLGNLSQQDMIGSV